MKKLLILISIVAASMFATARAAEPTLLYERGGDGTAWSNADLADWVNDNSSVTQTIDNGLSINFGNAGWSSTKEITFTPNSIVNLTTTITSGTVGNSANYDYFKVGDVEVRVNGQDQYVYIYIDGVENNSIKFKDRNVCRGGEYNITMTLDQALKTAYVKVSTPDSQDIETAEGVTYTNALPNQIVVGLHKGSTVTGRTHVLKDIKITEELQEVTMASYTVNYVCNGTTIKSEEGEIAVGAEISATSPLTVDGQKYYFVEGATTSMTVTAGSENVLNVEMREAYVYNYTVSNNVNDVVKTGTCVEGESVTVPFHRYILSDGKVYIKDPGSRSPYTETFTPDKNGYEKTLEYTVSTKLADGLYFIEGEDIEGMTATSNGNAGARGSNALGGYAAEAVPFYTLKPGKYVVIIANSGKENNEMTVKAGEETILTATTNGSWGEYTSEEFTVDTNTELTFEGAADGYPLDYILITGEVAKPVTGVTINDKDGKAVTALEMKEDESYQLSAVIEPENADVQTATWTTSNAEIATVSASGLVTARKAGEATITATAGEKSATCVVTVKASEIVVTALTLDKTEATVAVGGELQLTATVTPAEANVAWTSDNEEVATVEAGKVKAIAAGEATITAKSGEKTATCKVTVTVPVSGITLSMEKFTVDKGDEFTIGYTIVPDDATDKTVTWSSSKPEVATVDETGKVTAVAAGEAVITATAGAQSASCTVTVDETTATEGAVVKMTYVNMDQPNKAYGKILDGETAISGYNKISGGEVGFANTSWSVDYIAYLQVDASAIKDKYITSATLSFDASGATDGKRETEWGVGYNSSVWSSAMTYESADKSITTIGATQKTTTKASGTFENFSFDITEAINNAEGRIVTILVYETAAAGGYLKNPAVAIESTNEIVYNVTFAEKNEVEGLKVTVNEKDATKGIALPNGIYSFTATAPHYKDYTGEFTVADEDVEVSFEMTQKATWKYTVKNNVNAEVKEGTTFEGESATVPYNRYILATDGTVWMKDATNKEYNYTFTPEADNSVVTLEYAATETTDGIYFIEGEDIEGMTATSNGNAGVRASNAQGGYAAEAVAVYTLKPGTYVVKIANSGSKEKTMTVKAGEETVLTATTNGSWSEFTSEEFTVESDTELTFEGAADGYPLDYILITGEVTIAATGLEVYDGDVKLEEGAKLELHTGDAHDLKAVVIPSDATDQTVTWTSSNDEVAEVNAAGHIVSHVAGEAVITAKVADITFSVTVVVTDPVVAITGVALDKTTAEMLTGETLQLKATITPDDATSKKVTWSSSDATIATVDANGLVKALKAGEVTITAKANKIEATCKITITDPEVAVESITLDKTEATLLEGETLTLVATVIPEDATDATVTWTSSNEAVATVDANGKVTAISIGEAVITAKAGGKSAECVIKVDKTSAVELIGLDPEAPVKVYDMNGIYVSDSMEGLQQGYYIVRQANTAKKVFIRK